MGVDKKEDKINPFHYKGGKIECIEALKAALSKEEFIGFLRGNIIKYNWRCRLKNGIEDIQKSIWYANKLVETLEESLPIDTKKEETKGYYGLVVSKRIRFLHRNKVSLFGRNRRDVKSDKRKTTYYKYFENIDYARDFVSSLPIIDRECITYVLEDSHFQELTGKDPENIRNSLKYLENSSHENTAK